MDSLIKSIRWCLAVALLAGCQPSVSSVVGPSSSGLNVGVATIAGDGGLPADGISKATVRVEVYRADGELVTGATVILTTTRGTLASSSLTTTSGVATTTLTSSTTPGTAYIVATVENISATGIVQIFNINKTA